MASPVAIREFRYVNSSTFPTAFQNGASGAGSWDLTNAAVTKLRVTAYDDSGLTYEGLQDESLQDYLYANPAPIPGLRKGAIKFSTYMGSAYSNVDPNPEAKLLYCFSGGMSNPTNTRSTTAAANSGTANIAIGSANTYLTAGMFIMVGTRGDGAGEGEVRPVVSTASDHVNVAWPFKAAIASTQTVVIGTTIWPYEAATQQYIDTYAIGHATADHRQLIGGQGKVSFSGLNAGELPKMEIELQAADHRYVPSNARGTRTGTTAYKGNPPPTNRGLGMLQFKTSADADARTLVKAAEFTFDPGLIYEQIPDPTGPNGIGGWCRMRGKALFECTVLYDEDMPGLDDDFIAGSAKEILLQMGTAATKTCAIYIPSGYITEAPTTKAIGNLSGVRIKIHADQSSRGDSITTAPWYIAYF